ncbi:MAG TPA: UDP-N-acetylmuramate dehydrogenase [Candidatus Eisenbacteria bacterium]|nr:UDP-N-acetylmuramate dehydrogenase [Candidatus Eisenbacteria bacterium]
MNIQNNVVLAPYTTFGIGGPADFFVVVATLDELKEAIAYAKTNALSYFLLGTGANILVGDKGFRGLVIKNETKAYRFDGNILTAQSGATVADLIQLSKERGLSGLEDFAGIVSTVGGALWQNLHFLSSDRSKTAFIADILQSATVLHENGESEEVDASYFQFGYDKSILHASKDVVLSATFKLVLKDVEEIQKTIDENILWRKEKHPLHAEQCSAGSIFKKIEEFGAGRLIEKVGLKGKQIGGAQVSTVHANFIVNTGGATAKDVRDLITLIQAIVKKDLQLDLQPEISFVGEF